MKNEEMLLRSLVCASSIALQKKGVEISLRKFDRRGILITQPPKMKKKLKKCSSSSACKVKWSAKKSIDLLKEVLCTIGV